MSGMDGALEIVTGIAASGKTARLLDEYRQALHAARAAGRMGATLWLSPTNRACREIRERLCGGDLPVVFAPNVLTFDEFARRLLRSAGHVGVPLSPVMRRALLREVVSRLLAAGRLNHFGPIAETSGFLDLAGSFIAELKRGETWPEHFREACQRRGSTARDGDMADIYDAYQSALRARNVYDAEGRFWSARDELQRGSQGAFANLSFVAIDGFTDFTHTQREMISLLAERVPRVVVSLPVETKDGRDELFAKTAEMQRLLQAEGRGGRPRDLASPPAEMARCSSSGAAGRVPALPAGIQSIVENLFRNPREITPATEVDGVEVVAAAGEPGEVAWITARVKHWLITGVPPGAIVVAMRDLDSHADRLIEAFRAAHIPVACEIAKPLAREPLVKALVNTLNLELEDWPVARLMGLLDSSLFLPQWKEWRGGAVARDVSQVLRRFRLFQDRGRILARLRRAAGEAPAKGAAGSEQQSEVAAQNERGCPPVVARALPFLERLSRALEGLRQSHRLDGWAGLMAALVNDFGLTRSAAPTGPGAEDDTEYARRVADAVLALLADAARGEELACGERRSRRLPAFLPEFVDLLNHDSISPRIDEVGRVRVLSAEQVRNLDVPYLIVAGLSERSFPQSAPDDCLYSEADRQALNREGLALAHRVRRAQEEMLLFYGIVTRARKRLVLTYPVVSADGEPLSPSPYLTAVQELFSPSALPVVREEQLDPIPAADRILTSSDARVRGMQEALSHRPGLLRATCEDRSAGPASRAALAAADMNALRFHTPGFSNFEGLLENPTNLARTARQFSCEREFSATQLEAYAACPFRFFVSQVLRVQPLAAPGVETDYGERGTRVHAVLADLHRRFVRADGGSSSRVPTGAELAAEFERLLGELLGQLPERSELESALLSVEQRLLTEWGQAYGGQWEQYLQAQPGAAPLGPALLEVAFGQQAAHGAAGAAPALTVGLPGHTVRITGRIDRIDAAERDGRTMFSVVDYKTGAPQAFTPDDLATGRKLQLALYTLAVCRIEQLLGPRAVPAQMGYWHIRERGFLPGLKPRGWKAGDPLPGLSEAAWDAIAQQIDDVVPRLVESMRRGAFPVFNADESCTARCELRTICRVGQIRSLSPHLHKRV